MAGVTGFKSARVKPASFFASALQRPRLMVGDLVTTPAKAGWVSEVVDTFRVDNGYVVGRWRMPSGMSLQSMEESIRFLVRVPAIA